jgi:hypothetical protein
MAMPVDAKCQIGYFAGGRRTAEGIFVNRTATFGILSAALLSACGSSATDAPGFSGEASSRIMGGEDVRAGDPLAPSVVMVGQSGFEDCSATLLSEEIAVTAAHCVDPHLSGQPEFAEGFLVKFRSPGLPQQERSVDAYVVHPKWAETTEELRKVLLPRMLDPAWKDWGDVALVRFEGGLPEGYRAAELLDSAFPVKPNQDVVLAGFGSQADDSLLGPDRGVLRRVTVAVDRADADSFEFLFNQEDGKGSCKSDSGGPAFVEQGGKYFLLGATSRAVGAVENTVAKLCRHDSVYTDLRKVAGWLKPAMEKLRGR